MFKQEVYTERRKLLKKEMGSGILLFYGNDEIAMNYSANPYHFRQDSSFLYFFGIDKPGFIGVIDVENDRDYLLGEDVTLDDIIWMGSQPTVRKLGDMVGITETGSRSKLADIIASSKKKSGAIHYLPPYHAYTTLKLSALLEMKAENIRENASVPLIKAVVKQRSVKSKEEVAQIEMALDISYKMYHNVLHSIAPGKYEYELWGELEYVTLCHNTHISFPTILSVHGETLHNHSHDNKMQPGDLLVIDSGAESPLHYASDITRTFPVSGTFAPRQKDIYSIVLKAQKTAIDMIKPGINFKDIHIRTAEIITEGLKDTGLMKGNTGDIVQSGAHALFFPHGLGHMIGLDVHDMENLGENYVGYDQSIQRSTQFGLAFLRLAKKLVPNFILTIEPGIYFIPALIDKWKSENTLVDFINYPQLEKYRDFGGIRIEDDVLVTETAGRVLGKPIPKEIDDIENTIGHK